MSSWRKSDARNVYAGLPSYERAAVTTLIPICFMKLIRLFTARGVMPYSSASSLRVGGLALAALRATSYARSTISTLSTRLTFALPLETRCFFVATA